MNAPSHPGRTRALRAPSSRPRPAVAPRRPPAGRPETLTARLHSASPLSNEMRRWVLVLGLSFVASASFFATAIGLGAEWPIGPAVVVGPILMIGSYLYLSLTSDSNEAQPPPKP